MDPLDDRALYQRLDPQGMFRFLRATPDLCAEAWQAALRLPPIPGADQLDKVVLLGMGGSAIAGDLLAALVEPAGRVTVRVHRGYGLPPGIDARTLVIASSYSGATEETLSGFQESLATPAVKLALTSGGPLQQLAEAHDVPLLPIPLQAPPRATLPYALLALLGLFERSGLVNGIAEAVAEAQALLSEQLRELTEDVPQSRNPAKALASRLYGRLPVVYAGPPLTSAALRWKTQFNENSKVWAFTELLPELHHNAIVGLELPPAMTELAFVLLLYSPHQPAPLQRRYQVTAELLDRYAIRHEWVTAHGNSLLAQLLSLILFGDYVSCYLALLNGRDPWPVAPIDFVKSRLAAQGPTS